MKKHIVWPWDQITRSKMSMELATGQITCESSVVVRAGFRTAWKMTRKGQIERVVDVT